MAEMVGTTYTIRSSLNIELPPGIVRDCVKGVLYVHKAMAKPAIDIDTIINPSMWLPPGAVRDYMWNVVDAHDGPGYTAADAITDIPAAIIRYGIVGKIILGMYAVRGDFEKLKLGLSDDNRKN